MTFAELRAKAGHTQKQAAAYLYASVPTIERLEAGKHDPARLELYELKLRSDGIIKGK